jgi:sulfopyruvate decarboxylase alpha subunit
MRATDRQVDRMAAQAQRRRAREAEGATAWERWLADELVDSGVDAAVLLPDKRLDQIVVALRARDALVRVLAQEEECVAYAAGRFLAGGRPAVLMQSSGLGNSLNALGSLVVPYALGVPLIVSMRGTLGELNPSQVPMGRAAGALLAALGIQAFEVSRPDQVREVARGVVGMAGAGIAAAMLLGPELDWCDERR